MFKNILKSAALFFLLAGAGYAQMTSILTADLLPVQCNKWGWVQGYSITAWQGGCTPLEIKEKNGNVHSVESTEGLCADNESAVYYYRNGSEQITFVGCREVKG